MSYPLSPRDLATLSGVHPDICRVVIRASELSDQDFKVAEGLRTREAAAANAAKGTGIKDSLHIKQADGYGHAVDLHPLPLDWHDLASFRKVAAAMLQAADELGVLIQWGADWDLDGIVGERTEYDYPHFQLPLPFREHLARAARDRRMAERAQGKDVTA